MRPPAVRRSHRGPQHGVLPPLPALTALRARIAAAAALAVAYIALTMAVAAGLFDPLDKQVLKGFSSLWSESLHPLFQAIEVFYKATLYHPGTPLTIAHNDGPSITEAVSSSGALANSFPSGHMVRAVVVYGLIAFVVQRLAPWPLARALAIPVATLLIVLLAFDRLYLEVHWESDVLGGLLLGSIALLAATVWLDRPSPSREN